MNNIYVTDENMGDILFIASYEYGTPLAYEAALETAIKYCVENNCRIVGFEHATNPYTGATAIDNINVIPA